MTPALSGILALAILAGTTAASAEPTPISGRWRVTGKVASFSFSLDCRFDQHGDRLTGVCVDGGTNDPKVKSGRSHPLTQGSVDGNRVNWTYMSSFLITHFAVSYAGTLAGDRLTGQLNAQGHTGPFTAERVGG
jgi:hypothetical protein